MPGENLTRKEAIERASIVSVESYSVEIDLTQGAELFGSTTRVRFLTQLQFIGELLAKPTVLSLVIPT